MLDIDNISVDLETWQWKSSIAKREVVIKIMVGVFAEVSVLNGQVQLSFMLGQHVL